MFGRKLKTSKMGVFLIALACLASAPVLSQAFDQTGFGSQQSAIQTGGGAAVFDTDCNSDGQTDDPTDCNSNGQSDECDLYFGVADDCNSNGIPDECEVPTGGGETCEGGPTICPDVTYNGTLKGKQRDWYGDCGSDGDSPDVWYTYVPVVDCGNLSQQQAVNISVSVCSDTFDPIVTIYDYCPGDDCLLCKETAAAGGRACQVNPCDPPLTTTLITSHEYYIRVSAQYGDIGDGRYTLEVNSADTLTLCCAYAPANPTGGDDCNGDGFLDDCQLTRRALFSIDYDTGLIREISETSGQTLRTIVPQLPGWIIEDAMGLDQHPVTGELWSIMYTFSSEFDGPPIATAERGLEDGPNLDLVRIDPRTGKTHIVAPIDMDYYFYELAFNSDGSRLFIIADDSKYGEVLLEADQTNGTLTYLVEPGQGHYGEGIAFDDADGLIYRLGGIEPSLVTGPGAQVFETISPDTLAVTSLSGPTDHAVPTGMTYDPDNAQYPFYVANSDMEYRGGGYPSELWMQSQGSTGYFVGTLDHESSGLVLAFVSEDCNSNGILDECDIADETSLDCNLNGVPDECEEDCNGNGVPDECDLGGLYSAMGSSCCESGYINVIDPATAKTLRTIVVRLDESGWSIYGIKGLAQDPISGELFAMLEAYYYGVSNQRSGEYWLLCKVNRFSGLASIIRVMGSSYRYAGLAFDDTGRLFAVTGESGSLTETLFELDPQYGWENLLCTFGRGDSGETIAFNPVDGLLYHASGDSYSTNVTNGTPEPEYGQIFETTELPGLGGKAQIVNDCSTTDIPLSGNENAGTTRALTWWTDEGVFLFAGGGLYRLTSEGVASYIGGLDHPTKGLVYIAGTSQDCNGNQIPDECEPDCNDNGVPDDCEIRDCDGSPACGDCNRNGIPDGCEIDEGSANDCDENGVPDACELAADALYGIDYDYDRLYIFDKTTGEKLWDVTITMEGQYVYSGAGLAVHPLTGDLWGIIITAESSGPQDSRSDNHRHLAIINPITGVATDIGRIADRDTNRKYGAIAFDADGTLYGLTGASGTEAHSLFTFDQTNATATMFLELPEICSEGGFAMAYNPEDGLLYRVSEILNEEAQEIQTTPYFCVSTLEAINLDLQTITPFELSGDETYDFKAMTWDAGAGRFLLAARGYEAPTSQPVATNNERGDGDAAFMGLSTTGESTFITHYYPVVKGLAFLNPYGGAEDCNENGIPDDCEADCNSNGIADACDIADLTSTDCNGNGIPDECDAALALSACPDDISVQATDEAGIVVDYPTPAATGGCNPAVSIDPPSGSLLPVGTTTVNVTATDELGGELTCSFSVEVLGPGAPGGQENPPAGQGTPEGFCLPFIFQTLCGVPLCAGPCFLGGMLSSIIGLYGVRRIVRRRYRRRR